MVSMNTACPLFLLAADNCIISPAPLDLRVVILDKTEFEFSLLFPGEELSKESVTHCSIIVLCSF